jgi:hypothetical protein
MSQLILFSFPLFNEDSHPEADYDCQYKLCDPHLFVSQHRDEDWEPDECRYKQVHGVKTQEGVLEAPPFP